MNTQGRAVWLLKKYENRRLYDTEESRYVTLEEIAERIRLGSDPHIVDAKSGADLTQATLAQIIIEGRGASRLLPVPLLLRLIRMEDDVLTDFFSRFLVGALDFYQTAKHQAEAFSGMGAFGFGTPTFGPQEMLGRFFRGSAAQPKRSPPRQTPGRWPVESPPLEEEPVPTERRDAGELAYLRRELEALKERFVGKRAKKPATKTRQKKP